MAQLMPHAELAQACAQEARLLASVLALSEAQHQHIHDKPDANKVQSYLKRKQHLIVSIAAIEDRIRTAKQQWLELPAKQRAEESPELEAIIGDINAAAARIVELENESYNTLTLAKNKLGKDIAKLGAASKLAKAYRPQPDQASPRFTDKTR